MRSKRAEQPVVFVLYFVLRALVLVTLVRSAFLGHYEHTTWGFLCAGIGFALFDILNRSDSSKIKLTPLYMAVSAVAFSMCIGACWEIFEYLADSFIGVDMQKDTLVQTINTV